MPSFLEQINNKAKEEKANGGEPSVDCTPDEAPASAAQKPAATRTAQRESVSRPGGGIRSVDHASVVDHSFFFKKVWAVILCLLLVVALAVGAIVAVLQFRRVAVKDFTGRTIAEMRKWATEYKIVLDEATVYDETATEDVILFQDITSGKIAPNAVISVTYSKGCDPTLHIDFPDLLSMTGAEVKAFAEQYKLLGVKLVEENSDTVAKGGVIRYEFASAAVTEATFSRSDAVTVYVSKGEARPTNLVKMQDFVGKTKDAAQTWATTAKLTQFRFVSIMADGDPGTVIAQNIEAGALVETDATIIFTIVGTNGIVVPDFSAMTQETAKDVSGLRVTIINVYDNTVPFGAFISQSISANSLVDTDTAVTLRYSLGRPYLEDLTGKREDEIARLIYDYNQKGAAFTYTIVYADAAAAKGSITAVSRGGEFVSLNEALTFTVSRGTGTAAVSTVVVSDYSGVKQSEAQDLNADFIVTIKTAYSDVVPYGALVTQSLPAGTTVPKGDDAVAITLTYSLGKPYMESLVGRKENELPAILEKYNEYGAAFTLSTIYVNSSEPKGTVVAVNAADEYVAVNTAVTVSVSNGIPVSLIAPDYKNVLKENAGAVDKNVNVTVIERYSNTAAYGTLIAQSVAAGTAIPNGSNEITLTYSLGMPYLEGLENQTEQTIDQYFYDLNLKGADLQYYVNIVHLSPDDYVPRGQFVSANAEGRISCGSSVTICFSSGQMMN